MDYRNAYNPTHGQPISNGIDSRNAHTEGPKAMQLIEINKQTLYACSTEEMSRAKEEGARPSYVASTRDSRFGGLPVWQNERGHGWTARRPRREQPLRCVRAQGAVCSSRRIVKSEAEYKRQAALNPHKGGPKPRVEPSAPVEDAHQKGSVSSGLSSVLPVNSA